MIYLHRLASQRINDFLRIEVLLAIFALFEQLSCAMTEELVVGNLQFECLAVPFVVELDIIRVNEGELLI